jgi:murein DD-endopeptidase MepM/ murein hydrolase activator NlpD
MKSEIKMFVLFGLAVVLIIMVSTIMFAISTGSVSSTITTTDDELIKDIDEVWLIIAKTMGLDDKVFKATKDNNGEYTGIGEWVDYKEKYPEISSNGELNCGAMWLPLDPEIPLTPSGGKHTLEPTGHGVVKTNSVNAAVDLRVGENSNEAQERAKIGVDIYSPITGKVNEILSLGDYGNCIIITDGGKSHINSDEVAVLCHVSPLVSQGEEVVAGEIVGTISYFRGNFGPHLHFELKLNGDWVEGDGFMGTWEEQQNALGCDAIPSTSYGDTDSSETNEDEGTGNLGELPAECSDSFTLKKYDNVDQNDIFYGADDGDSCGSLITIEDSNDDSVINAINEFSSAYGTNGIRGGNLWAGKISGNGDSDSYNREDEGRVTLIFVPCNLNVANPIEYIYYFHGLSGFTEIDFSYITPQVEAMVEDERNFILIYPEMPYSYGEPTASYSSASCTRCGRQKSFIWQGTDGDFLRFHDNVLNQITNMEIGGVDIPSPSKISMVGHSGGGSALWKAAEYMVEIGVGLVTLSDSDYYGTSEKIYLESPNTIQNILVSHPTDGEGAHAPTWLAQSFMQQYFCADTDVKSVSSSVYSVEGYEQIRYVPLPYDHPGIKEISLKWVS